METKTYTIDDIPTLVDLHDPEAEFDLYIGRENKYRNLPHSKWHNPFHLKRESDRKMILDKHMEYLLNNKELLDSLHELSRMRCGCWCFRTTNKITGTGIGKMCHGHNLIKMYKKLVLSIEE